MSVKEKTEFITQPHLEAIRDAVKECCIEFRLLILGYV